jgi:hypothetical protein
MSVSRPDFNLLTQPTVKLEPGQSRPETTPGSETRNPEWEELFCSTFQEVLVKAERYQVAAAQHEKILREHKEGHEAGPDSSYARAHASQAESRALAEYARVLRIFMDLALNGKPKE